VEKEIVSVTCREASVGILGSVRNSVFSPILRLRRRGRRRALGFPLRLAHCILRAGGGPCHGSVRCCAHAINTRRSASSFPSAAISLAAFFTQYCTLYWIQGGRPHSGPNRRCNFGFVGPGLQGRRHLSQCDTLGAAPNCEHAGE